MYKSKDRLSLLQRNKNVVGKQEVFDWVNSVLDLNITTLSEFQTGAIFCQILDAYFQDSVPMTKVNFFASDDFGSLRNFKIFQATLNKLQLKDLLQQKDVKVHLITYGIQSELLEALQYLYKQCQGRKPLAKYDAPQRRGISMYGGTNEVPINNVKQRETNFRCGGKLQGSKVNGEYNDNDSLFSESRTFNGRLFDTHNNLNNRSFVTNSTMKQRAPSSVNKSQPQKAKKSAPNQQFQTLDYSTLQKLQNNWSHNNEPTFSKNTTNSFNNNSANRADGNNSKVKKGNHDKSRHSKQLKGQDKSNLNDQNYYIVSSIPTPSKQDTLQSRISDSHNSPYEQQRALLSQEGLKYEDMDSFQQQTQEKVENKKQEDVFASTSDSPSELYQEHNPENQNNLKYNNQGVSSCEAQSSEKENTSSLPNQNRSFIKQYSESSRIQRPNLPYSSIEQAYKSTERAYEIIKRSLPKLQSLVQTMTSSYNTQEMSTYAYMGKVRSMRDVVGTLTRHTLLLLSDLRNAALQNQQQKDFPEILTKVEIRLNEMSFLDQQFASLCSILDNLKDSTLQDQSPLQDQSIQFSVPNSNGKFQNYQVGDANGGQTSIPPGLNVQQLDQALRQVGEAQANLTNYDSSIQGQQSNNQKTVNKLETQDIQSQLTNGKQGSRAFRFGNFQIRVLRNGDVYKGKYIGGKKNGYGMYLFKNKDIYTGEFQEDKMEGFGVYTFAHQGRYEGTWAKALYNGIGMETFARGSTYHGEYAMGQRHGYGVCRYFNGDYYEGQWSKGIREGQGMQQCTDDSNYVGDYKKGKRHGYGIYSFSNQDQYFGQYQEDIPHGYGVYIFATGQRYEGQWSKGKKHGYSQYTVETGERYMGEWEYGKPQWIQSIEKLPRKVSTEIQEKLRISQEAAQMSRQAQESGASRAADHWKEEGITQKKIKQTIRKAEQAALDAQSSRTKAVEVSDLLDQQAQKMLSSFN